MTDLLTKEQLKELFEIQAEFDNRIPTRNLEDTVASLFIEFVEWINTLEFNKNWKKHPGKPLEVQLDELADFLAFNLQLGLLCKEAWEWDADVFDKSLDVMVEMVNEHQTLPKLQSVSFVHSLNKLTQVFTKEIDDSVFQVVLLPFLYANQYYSIEQLIDAYKKKMQHNHRRQDGTVDQDKGYV